ncbi:hypothetical protein N3Z16_00960 [Candidatus Megaera polyxenophila]|jgi:hypothetical protein|uniref:hypothetical protein n=1 Tax=Candidatus Megaera polyxenophila TaxID=988779 RepID=UPI00249F5190|nr:hypothetical protein N3Z16_00960 [Candidatus Megaera polyxenophila]
MFELFMMVTNGIMCMLSSISFSKLIYDKYNYSKLPNLLVNHDDNHHRVDHHDHKELVRGNIDYRSSY